MSTITVLAAVGAKALLFLYVWLASAIVAAELARSKGYGEKPGLGTGLILPVLGPVIWLFIPPRDANAEWHNRKPWQKRPRAADILGLGGGDIGPGETAVQPGEGAGPAAVNVANPEAVEPAPSSGAGGAETGIKPADAAPAGDTGTADAETTGGTPSSSGTSAGEGDGGAGSRPGESRG